MGILSDISKSRFLKYFYLNVFALLQTGFKNCKLFRICKISLQRNYLILFMLSVFFTSVSVIFTYFKSSLIDFIMFSDGIILANYNIK